MRMHTIGRCAAAAFVCVGDDEHDTANSIELPTEDNGTLLMKTLQLTFDGATGLKYRYAATGTIRACKPVDG